MKRLDWQLVRPIDGGTVEETLPMAELIQRLIRREAAAELSEDDQAMLDQLETDYYEGGPSHCEAVGAPVIEDDPRWESRVVDEYAAIDVDLELDEYLEHRRRQPDCERCKYTSPYSLFPMDPCEFSAGALEHVLTDPALVKQSKLPMPPARMKVHADALEEALRTDQVKDSPTVDARDYLTKAIYFLRFWADQGFAVLPVDIDEVLGFPWEGALAIPGGSDQDDDDEGETTYH
jgi:hypothetical protein